MTFHIEVVAGRSGAVDLIKRIHDLGCSAGVSLNPQTPVETFGGGDSAGGYDFGDVGASGVYGAGVYAGGVGEGAVSAA